MTRRRKVHGRGWVDGKVVCGMNVDQMIIVRGECKQVPTLTVADDLIDITCERYREKIEEGTL